MGKRKVQKPPLKQICERYKKLYGGTMRVTREEILRSGICDYYAAVLAP